MEFSKEKIRQIKRLMLLAALLVLMIVYSDKVLLGLVLLFGILKPFLIGGAIAFALNIPMRAIEEKIFARFRGKNIKKIRRPLCMVITIVLVSLVVSVVAGTVLPQVMLTASEIGKKIPVFMERVIVELDRLTKDYPPLAEQVSKLESIEIQWETILSNIIDFLKNGVGIIILETSSYNSTRK